MLVVLLVVMLVVLLVVMLGSNASGNTRTSALGGAELLYY